MMASRGDSHFTTYLRVQKWRVLQIEVHPMSGENTKMPCWFEDRHLQEVLQLLKGTISDRVQLKRSDTGKNMSKSSIATGPTVRIGYVFRPKPEYQMCLLPTSQPLYTSDSEDEASSSSYQYRNLGLHHEKLVVYCCLLKENSHHNSMAQIMSVLGENSPQPKTASISSYFNRVIPPSSLSQPSAPTSGQSSPKDEEQTGTDTRKRKLKCIVKRSGPKLSKKAKKVKSSTVTHSDPSNEHTVDSSSRDRETVTASTTSSCRDNYDDEFSRLSFYGDLPDNDEEIKASDKPKKKTSNKETHYSSKILSIDDEFETSPEKTKDNFQKNKEERKTSVLDEESDYLSTLRRVNTKTRKTLSTKNENLFPSESTLTTKCRADQTEQKSKPAKFSFKKCKLKNPNKPMDNYSDCQSPSDNASENDHSESDKGSCVESCSERENIISKDASISDNGLKRRYTSDSETSDVSLCLVMTPSPKYNKVRSSKLRQRNIDAGSTLNNFVLPDLVTNSPISSGCSPSKDFGVPNSEQTYRNVRDSIPCASIAYNSDLNSNWPRLEKDESCDIDCDKGKSAIPKKDPNTESDTDLPQIKLKKRDRSWRKSLALIMNAKRSPEKYQDEEEAAAIDCEKIDTDFMQDLAELPKHKMDLTEEFRSQLGQISDVSQLRESHIEKMVLGSKGYLQSIFMGKHHCTRHDDYKKGGSARFNLNFQVNLEMFTELQQDAVMEGLMTIFCKRHHNYMDYILKVLLPEMLIWILMEIKHTSYDEAAALMSGDVELDVGSGIGEDIIL